MEVPGPGGGTLIGQFQARWRPSDPTYVAVRTDEPVNCRCTPKLNCWIDALRKLTSMPVMVALGTAAVGLLRSVGGKSLRLGMPCETELVGITPGLTVKTRSKGCWRNWRIVVP